MNNLFSLFLGILLITFAIVILFKPSFFYIGHQVDLSEIKWIFSGFVSIIGVIFIWLYINSRSKNIDWKTSKKEFIQCTIAKHYCFLICLLNLFQNRQNIMVMNLWPSSDKTFPKSHTRKGRIEDFSAL
jgi:uncharacterized membrane protein